MKSMMKRTTLREIKGSFGRFFAIFAIIALGVGFFSGVRITTPAMVKTIDDFLKDKQIFDYRLISTLGWEDADVEGFQALPDVRYVEGSYSYDVLYTDSKDNEFVLKTHTLLEHINGLALTEGRMPTTSNECIVDADIKNLPELGSKIYVSETNEEATLDVLAYREFTVVGYANSSYYINFERGSTSIGNGSVSGFVYIPSDAFDSETYTEIFVRFNQDYRIYSDDYKSYMKQHKEVWEAAIEDIANNHYERLYNDAMSEIEDAKAELEDAKAEGEQELADTAESLEYAALILSDEEYAYSLSEYEKAVDEFNDEISDAEQEIADAEQELSELEQPDTYLLERNTNIGYACFESDSEIVAQVARIFPIFFILVAALVCMTTMSRMVEEQRTQIGTFKALGYSEGAIMGKFMFYSGSAAILGCIFGYIVGTILFPQVIWFTYQLMYFTLPMKYLFDVKLAVIAIAVALVCSIGTTWFSCRVELSETAAGLMRPKAPKAGKRVLLEYIPFIWKRMKFLHKVSIRNIFRYKRRLFMMVLGISGCTALLMTGFGLNDSVADFAEMQYDEIQIADAALVYNNGDGDILPASLEATLNELTADYLLLHEASWDLVTEDVVKSIDLVVPENFDTIDLYMNFHKVDGEVLDYPKSDEAYISNSISERYGVKLGDTITLRDDNMRELHVTVSGIFENHVYNYVYLSPETMEKQLNEVLDYNAAYINIPDNADIYSISAKLMQDDNVTTVTLFSELKNRLSKMMNSLNYVVLLVILSAAGLAFIVIYNLTNINITERIREIATIKVLGFFKNETSSYVFRENIVLTAIGTAVGLILGILLHRFVMAQIVVDMVSFRVHIKPISFVYSIVLTFVFNFLVNAIMNVKLDRINMAESLKSIE
ncbi:MAG: FtsX-like permease family protein [Lachnospiraceae bacterium]|nr:FtsX-like permease family protein [Lachnospiraceae bacterium]